MNSDFIMMAQSQTYNIIRDMWTSDVPLIDLGDGTFHVDTKLSENVVSDAQFRDLLRLGLLVGPLENGAHGKHYVYSHAANQLLNTNKLKADKFADAMRVKVMLVAA